MGRRTWIKIYADKWLRGTIREEPPEIRGIWIDLLALAGDSAYGDEGIIRLAPGCGLTDEQICVILNINNDLWQRAKQRLIETERITVTDNNEIIIKEQTGFNFCTKFDSSLHKKIFQIDNYECVYCGSKRDLSIDHIIPRSCGGSDDIDNLVTACMTCNRKKNARTPEEAGMKLLFGRFRRDKNG